MRLLVTSGVGEWCWHVEGCELGGGSRGKTVIASLKNAPLVGVTLLGNAWEIIPAPWCDLRYL